MAETELNFFKSTKTETKEAEETKIPQETKEEIEELTPKATLKSLEKDLNKMKADVARIRLKTLGAEDTFEKINKRRETSSNLTENEKKIYKDLVTLIETGEADDNEKFYYLMLDKKSRGIEQKEGPFFKDIVTLKINIEGGAQANALASGDPRNFADEIYRNLYSRDTFDVQKWSNGEATTILSGLYWEGKAAAEIKPNRTNDKASLEGYLWGKYNDAVTGGMRFGAGGKINYMFGETDENTLSVWSEYTIFDFHGDSVLKSKFPVFSELKFQYDKDKQLITNITAFLGENPALMATEQRKGQLKRLPEGVCLNVLMGALHASPEAFNKILNAKETNKEKSNWSMILRCGISYDRNSKPEKKAFPPKRK